MLIEKDDDKINKGTGMVYVPHLHQTGKVLEHVGATQVRVQLTGGATIILEESQVEYRQVLMG